MIVKTINHLMKIARKTPVNVFFMKKKHKNISQLDKTSYILQEFCQIVWFEKFAKITWSHDTPSLKTGQQGSRVMIVPDCSQFAGRSEHTKLWHRSSVVSRHKQDLNPGLLALWCLRQAV